MDILNSTLDYGEWLRFFDYKKSGGHLRRAEEQELKEFIENKRYLPVAQKLCSGGCFGVPAALQVNKSSTNRKRTVFTFADDEKNVQKFIAYKLLEYDGIFADNLYSFRRNMGVKKAVIRLFYAKGIQNMYSYKVDISDYFNSVSPEILLPELKKVLRDDLPLYRVIEDMLNCPFAISDGTKAEMKKGILAGSPLSGFLANLYLEGLDRHFEENGVLYARYSDDIIIFAESEDEIERHAEYLNDFLKSRRLGINERKVCRTNPHEKWTFLGFSYSNGVIDIAEVSKDKLKKKMRRKARALVRWKRRKGASAERAAAAFIRYFNKKLYENDAMHEITWCRWYFPVITTSSGLREIDEYTQQCIRYIATEKQNKGKFRFKYADMKSLGYTTLVNNYYKFKSTGKTDYEIREKTN
ncbi:MAG: hypothetical protein E7571_01235 [Ruminococcaceae bacterium]|nr:hypothetical protein [Oscillospiraceae bacterium]